LRILNRTNSIMMKIRIANPEIPKQYIKKKKILDPGCPKKAFLNNI